MASNNSTMRPERKTQNRVIKLFTDNSIPNSLGYEYLGEWSSKSNKNIETDLLKNNLRNRGYNDAQISAALLELEKASETTGSSLYQTNLRTYNLLRYPIKVKISASGA